MKKPSKIKSVKAKKAWFLLPSFKAITMFGVVYCKKKSDIESINHSDAIDSRLKCHETIHVRQAEGIHDSWLLFYLKYIFQWLHNLPLIFVNVHAAYKFMPLEIEAFANQDDFDYCSSKCDGWKKYKRLTMKQRRAFAKQYFKNKVYFSNFIKTYIDPVLN